ncbi:hypothetical protein [Microbacterium sp. zg.Y1084]|uniref:hypothetical protein n=2 Tax=Microbacterium TaxID=33882 RepID=UPI00214B0DBD|nr:hypothetical protein [Microbacterium sp. zg.Y1084]MCR2812143.1 hypothetical protein [Microbacterium sp. zg.Y1084]
MVSPISDAAPASAPDDSGALARRLEITIQRPKLALYAGLRPTLVIDGRGQPTQWGVGTWQVPPGAHAVIAVYLFNRLWRFGQAEATVAADALTPLVYRAPVLPFGRGRLAPRR